MEVPGEEIIRYMIREATKTALRSTTDAAERNRLIQVFCEECMTGFKELDVAKKKCIGKGIIRRDYAGECATDG